MTPETRTAHRAATTDDATPSVADLIRRTFDAYVRKDRAAIEQIMALGLHFSSPYDDRIDRKTYFERCWPNSEAMTSVDIEEIFEEGDEAFVKYRATLADGKEFRNVEFFRAAGGEIVEIDVYFGRTLKEGARS